MIQYCSNKLTWVGDIVGQVDDCYIVADQEREVVGVASDSAGELPVAAGEKGNSAEGDFDSPALVYTVEPTVGSCDHPVGAHQGTSAYTSAFETNDVNQETGLE